MYTQLIGLHILFGWRSYMHYAVVGICSIDLLYLGAFSLFQTSLEYSGYSKPVFLPIGLLAGPLSTTPLPSF